MKTVLGVLIVVAFAALVVAYAVTNRSAPPEPQAQPSPNPSLSPSEKSVSIRIKPKTITCPAESDAQSCFELTVTNLSDKFTLGPDAQCRYYPRSGDTGEQEVIVHLDGLGPGESVKKSVELGQQGVDTAFASSCSGLQAA